MPPDIAVQIAGMGALVLPLVPGPCTCRPGQVPKDQGDEQVQGPVCCEEG